MFGSARLQRIVRETGTLHIPQCSHQKDVLFNYLSPEQQCINMHASHSAEGFLVGQKNVDSLPGDTYSIYIYLMLCLTRNYDENLLLNFCEEVLVISPSNSEISLSQCSCLFVP